MWPTRSSSGRCSGGDAAWAGAAVARQLKNRAFRSGCIAHTSSCGRAKEYVAECSMPTISALSGLRRRPVIDSLQCIAHEDGPVGIGQAVGDAKRLDSLLVGQ